MAGIFNLLTGIKNKVTNTPAWQVAAGDVRDIQIDENGNIQPQYLTLGEKAVSGLHEVPRLFNEGLFGKQAEPTDRIAMLEPQPLSVQGENGIVDVYRPTLDVAVSENPRSAGFLTDLNNGMNENFNNALGQAPNLNIKKGVGYRIGEGLGTLARGLAGALGDSYIAGSQGLDAALKRQAVRTGDQLYRQQLKDDYGYTDEDLANVKGFIDTNTFNSLTKSQNSALNMALKQQTTQSMNKLRELQAQALEIKNSTLPEMQKAKLLQEIAKAEHAEEMQLARINFYNNNAALGWANFGLKADKAEREAEMENLKKEILESLKGGGTVTPTPTPTPQPQPKHRTNAF